MIRQVHAEAHTAPLPLTRTALAGNDVLTFFWPPLIQKDVPLCRDFAGTCHRCRVGVERRAPSSLSKCWGCCQHFGAGLGVRHPPSTTGMGLQEGDITPWGQEDFCPSLKGHGSVKRRTPKAKPLAPTTRGAARGQLSSCTALSLGTRWGMLMPAGTESSVTKGSVSVGTCPQQGGSRFRGPRSRWSHRSR